MIQSLANALNIDTVKARVKSFFGFNVKNLPSHIAAALDATADFMETLEDPTNLTIRLPLAAEQLHSALWRMDDVNGRSTKSYDLRPVAQALFGCCKALTSPPDAAPASRPEFRNKIGVSATAVRFPVITVYLWVKFAAYGYFSAKSKGKRLEYEVIARTWLNDVFMVQSLFDNLVSDLIRCRSIMGFLCIKEIFQYILRVFGIDRERPEARTRFLRFCRIMQVANTALDFKDEHGAAMGDPRTKAHFHGLAKDQYKTLPTSADPMFRTHVPKATAVTIFVKAWAEELEHVGGPTMQQGLLSDFGITDEAIAEFVTQDISIFFSSRRLGELIVGATHTANKRLLTQIHSFLSRPGSIKPVSQGPISEEISRTFAAAVDKSWTLADSEELVPILSKIWGVVIPALGFTTPNFQHVFNALSANLSPRNNLHLAKLFAALLAAPDSFLSLHDTRLYVCWRKLLAISFESISNPQHVDETMAILDGLRPQLIEIANAVASASIFVPGDPKKSDAFFSAWEIICSNFAVTVVEEFQTTDNKSDSLNDILLHLKTEYFVFPLKFMESFATIVAAHPEHANESGAFLVKMWNRLPIMLEQMLRSKFYEEVKSPEYDDRCSKFIEEFAKKFAELPDFLLRSASEQWVFPTHGTLSPENDPMHEFYKNFARFLRRSEDGSNIMDEMLKNLNFESCGASAASKEAWMGLPSFLLGELQNKRFSGLTSPNDILDFFSNLPAVWQVAPSWSRWLDGFEAYNPLSPLLVEDAQHWRNFLQDLMLNPDTPLSFAHFQQYTPQLRKYIEATLNGWGGTWQASLDQFQAVFEKPAGPYRQLPALVQNLLPWFRFLQFLKDSGCNNREVREFTQVGAEISVHSSMADLVGMKEELKIMLAELERFGNPWIESDSVGLRQNSLIPFLFSNAQTVNVESDEAAPLSQKPWLEEVDWPITQRQSAAPRSKILARLMATAIRPDREAQNLGLEPSLDEIGVSLERFWQETQSLFSSGDVPISRLVDLWSGDKGEQLNEEINCIGQAPSLQVDKNLKAKFEAALRLVAIQSFLPAVTSTLSVMVETKVIPIVDGEQIEQEMATLRAMTKNILELRVSTADNDLRALCRQLADIFPGVESYEAVESLMEKTRGFFSITDSIHTALELIPRLGLQIDDLEHFNAKAEIIRSRIRDNGEGFNERIFIDFGLTMDLFSDLSAASGSLKYMLQALLSFNAGQQDVSFIEVVARNTDDIQSTWEAGNEDYQKRLNAQINDVLDSGRFVASISQEELRVQQEVVYTNSSTNKVSRISGLDAITDFIRGVVFFNPAASGTAFSALIEKLQVCLAIGNTLSGLHHAGALAVIKGLDEIPIGKDATAESVLEQEKRVQQLADAWMAAVVACRQEYPMTWFIPGVLLYRFYEIMCFQKENRLEAFTEQSNSLISPLQQLTFISTMVPGVAKAQVEAKLPQLLSNIPLDMWDKLERIGTFLRDTMEPAQGHSALGLKEYLCHNRQEVLHAALSPFMNQDRVPPGCVLMCTTKTTEEDVIAFFQRVEIYKTTPFVLIEPHALSRNVRSVYHQRMTLCPQDECSLVVVTCDSSANGEAKSYRGDVEDKGTLLQKTAARARCFTGPVGCGKTRALQMFVEQNLSAARRIAFPILEGFTCDAGISRLLDNDAFVRVATSGAGEVVLDIRVSPCIEQATHDEVELFLFKLLILNELHRANSTSILRLYDPSKIHVVLEVPPMQPRLYAMTTSTEDGIEGKVNGAEERKTTETVQPRGMGGFWPLLDLATKVESLERGRPFEFQEHFSEHFLKQLLTFFVERPSGERGATQRYWIDTTDDEAQPSGNITEDGHIDFGSLVDPESHDVEDLVSELEQFVVNDPEIGREWTHIDWTPRRRVYLLRLIGEVFSQLFTSSYLRFNSMLHFNSILAEALIRQSGRLLMPKVMEHLKSHALAYLNPEIGPDRSITSYHLLRSSDRQTSMILRRGRILAKTVSEKEIVSFRARNEVPLASPDPLELGGNAKALIKEVARAFDLSKQAVKRALKEIDYVITYDYAIKLITVRLRHRGATPTILEGETGVGKTEMLRFYSALLNAHSKEQLSRKLVVAMQSLNDIANVRPAAAGSEEEKKEPIAEEESQVQQLPMLQAAEGELPRPVDQENVERFETHGIGNAGATAISAALQQLATSLFEDDALSDKLKAEIGDMFVDAQQSRDCPLSRISQRYLSRHTYNFCIVVATLNYFAMREDEVGLNRVLEALKKFAVAVAADPVVDPRRLLASLFLATQPSPNEVPQFETFSHFRRKTLGEMDVLSLPALYSYCEEWFVSGDLPSQITDLSFSRDVLPEMFLDGIWNINPSDVLEATEKYLTLIRAFRVFVCPPTVPVFLDVKVHGGMTLNDIKSILRETIAVAQRQLEATTFDESGKEVTPVVFFDEINTSTQLGTFQDIMVDNVLDGKKLPRNVFWVAASNPKRTKQESIEEGGRLSYKHRDFYDVFELPTALRDLVTQFSALDKRSEKAYNYARLEQIPMHPKIAAAAVWGSLFDVTDHTSAPPEWRFLRGRLFGLPFLYEFLGYASDCLQKAQQFMRANLSNSAVSQRDLERAFKAIKFFFDMKIDRHLHDGGEITKHFLRVAVVKSIMLALALVYYLRLDTRENKRGIKPREKFLQEMEGRYIYNHDTGYEDIVSLKECLEEEIKEFLRHSSIPSGIAPNLALAENVWAQIICLQLKIPIMIIGPPGSSKTLSFRIVADTLRGESSNDFFKAPTPFVCIKNDVLTYQCSADSTDAEIKSIFDAGVERQRAHAQRGSRNRAVVFMDETNLAELDADRMLSPLKIIHHYLDHAEVGCVALANRQLDAAKSNRAITVLRHEYDESDIVNLGLACFGLPTDNMEIASGAQRKEPEAVFVRACCKAYLELQNDRRFKFFQNTFQLRDLYHFFRYLQRKTAGRIPSYEVLLQAIERNFNSGSSEDLRRIAQRWVEVLLVEGRGSAPEGEFEIPELSHYDGQEITLRPQLSVLRSSLYEREQVAHNDRVGQTRNLNDSAIRYIMLIDDSKDEMGLQYFMDAVLPSGTEPEVLELSSFSSDESAVKKTIFLRRLERAMAAGRTVVLVHAEEVFGALYDVFNQHYQVVCSRKTGELQYWVNVAIGAYSRKCLVHPNFMCIVHTSKAEFNSLPMPLKNRFEKYRINIEEAYEEMLANLKGDRAREAIERSLATLEDLVALFPSDGLYGVQAGPGSGSITLKSAILTKMANIPGNTDQGPLLINGNDMVMRIAAQLIHLSRAEAFFFAQPGLPFELKAERLNNSHSSLRHAIEYMRQSLDQDAPRVQKAMFFCRDHPHLGVLVNSARDQTSIERKNNEEQRSHIIQSFVHPEGFQKVTMLDIDTIDRRLELDRCFAEFEKDEKEVLILTAKWDPRKPSIINSVRQAIDKVTQSPQISATQACPQPNIDAGGESKGEEGGVHFGAAGTGAGAGATALGLPPAGPVLLRSSSQTSSQKKLIVLLVSTPLKWLSLGAHYHYHVMFSKDWRFHFLDSLTEGITDGSSKLQAQCIPGEQWLIAQEDDLSQEITQLHSDSKATCEESIRTLVGGMRAPATAKQVRYNPEELSDDEQTVLQLYNSEDVEDKVQALNCLNKVIQQARRRQNTAVDGLLPLVNSNLFKLSSTSNKATLRYILRAAATKAMSDTSKESLGGYLKQTTGLMFRNYAQKIYSRLIKDFEVMSIFDLYRNTLSPEDSPLDQIPPEQLKLEDPYFEDEEERERAAAAHDLSGEDREEKKEAPKAGGWVVNTKQKSRTSAGVVRRRKPAPRHDRSTESTYKIPMFPTATMEGDVLANEDSLIPADTADLYLIRSVKFCETHNLQELLQAENTAVDASYGWRPRHVGERRRLPLFESVFTGVASVYNSIKQDLMHDSKITGAHENTAQMGDNETKESAERPENGSTRERLFLALEEYPDLRMLINTIASSRALRFRFADDAATRLIVEVGLTSLYDRGSTFKATKKFLRCYFLCCAATTHPVDIVLASLGENGAGITQLNDLKSAIYSLSLLDQAYGKGDLSSALAEELARKQGHFCSTGRARGRLNEEDSLKNWQLLRNAAQAVTAKAVKQWLLDALEEDSAGATKLWEWWATYGHSADLLGIARDEHAALVKFTGSLCMNSDADHSAGIVEAAKGFRVAAHELRAPGLTVPVSLLKAQIEYLAGLRDLLPAETIRRTADYLAFEFVDSYDRTELPALAAADTAFLLSLVNPLPGSTFMVFPRHYAAIEFVNALCRLATGEQQPVWRALPQITQQINTDPLAISCQTMNGLDLLQFFIDCGDDYSEACERVPRLAYLYYRRELHRRLPRSWSVTGAVDPTMGGDELSQDDLQSVATLQSSSVESVSLMVAMDHCAKAVSFAEYLAGQLCRPADRSSLIRECNAIANIRDNVLHVLTDCKPVTEYALARALQTIGLQNLIRVLEGWKPFFREWATATLERLPGQRQLEKAERDALFPSFEGDATHPLRASFLAFADSLEAAGLFQEANQELTQAVKSRIVAALESQRPATVRLFLAEIVVFHAFRRNRPIPNLVAALQDGQVTSGLELTDEMKPVLLALAQQAFTVDPANPNEWVHGLFNGWRNGDLTNQDVRDRCALWSIIMGAVVNTFGCERETPFTMALFNPRAIYKKFPVGSGYDTFVSERIHYDCGVQLSEDGTWQYARPPLRDDMEAYYLLLVVQFGLIAVSLMCNPGIHGRLYGPVFTSYRFPGFARETESDETYLRNFVFSRAEMGWAHRQNLFGSPEIAQSTLLPRRIMERLREVSNSGQNSSLLVSGAFPDHGSRVAWEEQYVNLMNEVRQEGGNIEPPEGERFLRALERRATKLPNLLNMCHLMNRVSRQTSMPAGPAAAGEGNEGAEDGEGAGAGAGAHPGAAQDNPVVAQAQHSKAVSPAAFIRGFVPGDGHIMRLCGTEMLRDSVTMYSWAARCLSGPFDPEWARKVEISKVVDGYSNVNRLEAQAIRRTLDSLIQESAIYVRTAGPAIEFECNSVPVPEFTLESRLLLFVSQSSEDLGLYTLVDGLLNKYRLIVDRARAQLKAMVGEEIFEKLVTMQTAVPAELLPQSRMLTDVVSDSKVSRLMLRYIASMTNESVDWDFEAIERQLVMALASLPRPTTAEIKYVGAAQAAKAPKRELKDILARALIGNVRENRSVELRAHRIGWEDALPAAGTKALIQKVQKLNTEKLNELYDSLDLLVSAVIQELEAARTADHESRNQQPRRGRDRGGDGSKSARRSRLSLFGSHAYEEETKGVEETPTNATPSQARILARALRDIQHPSLATVKASTVAILEGFTVAHLPCLLDLLHGDEEEGAAEGSTDAERIQEEIDVQPEGAELREIEDCIEAGFKAFPRNEDNLQTLFDAVSGVADFAAQAIPQLPGGTKPFRVLLVDELMEEGEAFWQEMPDCLQFPIHYGFLLRTIEGELRSLKRQQRRQELSRERIRNWTPFGSESTEVKVDYSFEIATPWLQELYEKLLAREKEEAEKISSPIASPTSRSRSSSPGPHPGLPYGFDSPGIGGGYPVPSSLPYRFSSNTDEVWGGGGLAAAGSGFSSQTTRDLDEVDEESLFANDEEEYSDSEDAEPVWGAGIAAPTADYGTAEGMEETKGEGQAAMAGRQVYSEHITPLNSTGWPHPDVDDSPTGLPSSDLSGEGLPDSMEEDVHPAAPPVLPSGVGKPRTSYLSSLRSEGSLADPENLDPAAASQGKYGVQVPNRDRLSMQSGTKGKGEEEGDLDVSPLLQRTMMLNSSPGRAAQTPIPSSGSSREESKEEVPTAGQPQPLPAIPPLAPATVPGSVSAPPVPGELSDEEELQMAIEAKKKEIEQKEYWGEDTTAAEADLAELLQKQKGPSAAVQATKKDTEAAVPVLGDLSDKEQLKMAIEAKKKEIEELKYWGEDTTTAEAELAELLQKQMGASAIVLAIKKDTEAAIHAVRERVADARAAYEDLKQKASARANILQKLLEFEANPSLFADATVGFKHDAYRFYTPVLNAEKEVEALEARKAVLVRLVTLGEPRPAEDIDLDWKSLAAIADDAELLKRWKEVKA